MKRKLSSEQAKEKKKLKLSTDTKIYHENRSNEPVMTRYIFFFLSVKLTFLSLRDQQNEK